MNCNVRKDKNHDSVNWCGINFPEKKIATYPVVSGSVSYQLTAKACTGAVKMAQ
jgi:hypothetical protein